MTLTTILLQAIAQLTRYYYFFNCFECTALYVVTCWYLGMGVWILYILLKDPTNVIVATFIAAVIGSCISQILSILYKTPVVVFVLAILAPLVPGYLSYRTTAFLLLEIIIMQLQVQPWLSCWLW